MALKLFRTTGYSTLLMPGEERQSLHPGWLVAMASLWIALACNAGLWRLLAAPGTLRAALATAALLGGGSGVILSLLGWRRTIRLAITAMVAAAALVACGLWVQDLPIETLWQQRPRTLLPPWPTFMGWQVPTLMLVLAVVPIVWVWNLPLRRLRGPEQLQVNITGALLGAVVFGVGLFLLP
jgi:glucan phosphoethanolaminetransferase (alkaline phosphatase superfamily)